MGFPDVTYNDYVEGFGYSVKPDAFTEYLPSATAVVRDLCYPNQPETQDQQDAYVLAVCAAIQADVMSGSTHGADLGASSFTIGKFSMSGNSSGASGESAVLSAMRSAARLQLVGSGLLYRVIM